MAEIVCPRCAHPNSAASNFCSSCGFDLERVVEEATGQHPVISQDVAEDAHADAQAADVVDEASEDHLADVHTTLDGEEAVFVVKRGPKAGSRFTLDTPVVSLGRHPDSTIFLDDITVSRRHAEVRLTDHGFHAFDAGSLNGTYLNRERIEEAGSRLTSGDELQVGKFKLVFLTGEAQ